MNAAVRLALDVACLGKFDEFIDEAPRKPKYFSPLIICYLNTVAMLVINDQYRVDHSRYPIPCFT